jgi:predicted transglutaminase-like cysteine proteinase
MVSSWHAGGISMLKILTLPLLTIILASCGPVDKIQMEHSAALRKHVYITDIDQYGVIDKWVPSLYGDCEDYALYMMRKLGGQILIVRVSPKELHAVLDVDGRIVDNLRKDVYPIEKMTYKLIARVPLEKTMKYVSL